ncbi:MAG: hypothetical protein OEW42_00175 [Acidimicrobiia bacterium]|nr:hypothetical protein [Acidimicrobiia bacterium]MDH5236509.1 hypothetical protein [Acidimicrobiia bacterium]
MQRWSEHVRNVTGEYPQVTRPQKIDLTVIDLSETGEPDPFGPGESLDVTIPLHLLTGGNRHREFDWR